MDISYKILPNEQKKFFYTEKNIIQKNPLEYPYQLEIDNFNYSESNNKSPNEYKGLSLFPKKNFPKSNKKKKQNQIFDNLETKTKVKKKGKKNKKTKNKIEKKFNQELNENDFKGNNMKKKESNENKKNLNNSNFSNNFNYTNLNQKNSFLKNSPKLSLFKENDSEDTTSFTTGNNLSPSENNSFTNNPVELNSKLLFQKKQISNSVENIFKQDINFKNGKNIKSVLIFPNLDKKEKKKNKKKKNSIYINHNIFNEYNIYNDHNNLTNLYDQCLSRKNLENLYSNLYMNINNYNIYPQNYNIIEKTDKNVNNFSIQELNNKNNNQINQFRNLNFNNNNLSNVKETENEYKKKYIYMRDIIVNYPKKLNPKNFKPFVMKKQIEKEKKIVLNLKIKIDNNGNEIEIPIREGENPLNILEKLIIKSDLNEDKMKRINFEIQKTLNFIDSFKNLFIRNNSFDIISEINNCINRNCNKDFYNKSNLFFNKYVN